MKKLFLLLSIPLLLTACQEKYIVNIPALKTHGTMVVYNRESSEVKSAAIIPIKRSINDTIWEYCGDCSPIMTENVIDTFKDAAGKPIEYRTSRYF
jgi:hypothetical protein